MATKISLLIKKNNVLRNFSILGGEPLCEENIVDVTVIISLIRLMHPNIKIFLWTGYTMEELIKRTNVYTEVILALIDVLIDGPYIEEERDITLPLRGSRNQRIWKKEDGEWIHD